MREYNFLINKNEEDDLRKLLPYLIIKREILDK